ncbi:MAG: AI-2E family transporter [Chloroflexales bacterium]|nr:AI-2E family transporter [Chloroflexales bacterium]
MDTFDTASGAPARSHPLRETAQATLVVLLVLLGFALILSLRNLVVSVFLGLMLATALRPVMGRLREGRLPRFLAASSTILLLLGVVAAFLLIVVPRVASQADSIARAVPELYEGARGWLIASRFRLFQQIGNRLEPTLPAGDLGLEILWPRLIPTLSAVGYLSFVTVCTLVFTYYWLLYRERSIRGLLLLLPIERREGAERIWLEIEGRIGDFLRGQAILALTVGGASLVGYWVAGVPFAVMLAIVAAVFELVPFIGPFIATGAAIAVSLSEGPQTALAALAVGLVVQQIENNFLAPRIMDETVGVSPVVTLLAFVGFGALFGAGGALLAIPLTAAIQVLFTAWLQRAPSSAAVAPAGRTLADRLLYEARVLAADIAGHLRAKDAGVQAGVDAPEEALEQILHELEAILESSEPPGTTAATEQAIEVGQ